MYRPVMNNMFVSLYRFMHSGGGGSSQKSAARKAALISRMKPGLWVSLIWLALQANAEAAGTDLKTMMSNVLGIVMLFAFVIGVVMVISGFMRASRDENWKMTIIYGFGIAGAVVLMTALYYVAGLQQSTVKVGNDFTPTD